MRRTIIAWVVAVLVVISLAIHLAESPRIQMVYAQNNNPCSQILNGGTTGQVLTAAGNGQPPPCQYSSVVGPSGPSGPTGSPNVYISHTFSGTQYLAFTHNLNTLRPVVGCYVDGTTQGVSPDINDPSGPSGTVNISYITASNTTLDCVFNAAGVTGPSGVSGVSGISGVSGVSGVSGTPGGPSGPSGPSGVSGASGASNSGGPGVAVFNTNNWTASSGGGAISWDTISWDTSGGTLFSTSVNPSRFTATTAGHWMLTCTMATGNSNNPGLSEIVAGENGTVQALGAGTISHGNADSNYSITMTWVLNMAQGDYATCNYYASSTITMNGSAGGGLSAAEFIKLF